MTYTFFIHKTRATALMIVHTAELEVVLLSFYINCFLLLLLANECNQNGTSANIKTDVEMHIIKLLLIEYKLT